MDLLVMMGAADVCPWLDIPVDLIDGRGLILILMLEFMLDTHA